MWIKSCVDFHALWGVGPEKKLAHGTVGSGGESERRGFRSRMTFARNNAESRLRHGVRGGRRGRGVGEGRITRCV